MQASKVRWFVILAMLAGLASVVMVLLGAVGWGQYLLTLAAVLLLVDLVTAT